MAHAALAGINPMYLLDATSYEQFVAIRKVAERAIEISGRQREDLATRIINALSDALSRGASRASSGPKNMRHGGQKR